MEISKKAAFFCGIVVTLSCQFAWHEHKNGGLRFSKPDFFSSAEAKTEEISGMPRFVDNSTQNASDEKRLDILYGKLDIELKKRRSKHGDANLAALGKKIDSIEHKK